MLTSESSPSDLAPPGFTSREQEERISKNFLRAGLDTSRSVELIKKLSGNNQSPSTDDSPDLLTLIITLLVLPGQMNRSSVLDVLGAEGLDDWKSCGLVYEQEDTVRGAVKLYMYQGVLFFFDHADSGRKKDHVIGMTQASLTLAQLTIRDHVSCMLDIGTGSGIQGLLGAKHSDRVVATDINARAISFADFSARMNGLQNFDSRTGDLLEPVKDESFDLIVSCPPFVISPENKYFYLDSGIYGDGLLEKLVTESALHLNEGGYCQIMCEVAQYEGTKWYQRVAEWVKDIDCDAWMLHRQTMSPAEHARMWVKGRSNSSIDDWVNHYVEEGIESISSGMLTLRKRTAQNNWFTIHQIAHGDGQCGHSIKRRFESIDYLNSIGSAQALLSKRICIAPDAGISDLNQPAPDNAPEAKATIRFTSGLLFSELISESTELFIRQCIENRTVDEAIRHVEAASATPVDKNRLFNELHKLIGMGFLIESK